MLKLTSSWPPARVGEVPSCSLWTGSAALSGSCGSGIGEARFGATLLHFCSLLLSAPHPWGCCLLLVLNSEKLAWEQHSFTFAHFCCPRPAPGAAAGAGGAKFCEASFGATPLHFCYPCPAPGAAAGAEFRAASCGATLHHFCFPLLGAPPPNTKETTKRGRPKAAPLCGGGRRPPPLFWLWTKHMS